MFVIGCLTALRYSDYSRLTSQNLVDGYIMIRTKKTNVDVKVPAHDYVKEILKNIMDLYQAVCVFSTLTSI